MSTGTKDKLLVRFRLITLFAAEKPDEHPTTLTVKLSIKNVNIRFQRRLIFLYATSFPLFNLMIYFNTIVPSMSVPHLY